MYCVACGTPLAPGLSYCNRCGASLKNPREGKSGSIPAFLTAITLIATIGLGIMLGGALTLKRDAEMGPELVGFFMLFTFLIVVLTEVLLVRQLSRLTSVDQHTRAHQPVIASADARGITAGTPGEPVPSVTENTTRTLEYSSKS